MIVRIFSSNRIFIFAFIPVILLAFRFFIFWNEAPVQVSGYLPWINELYSFLSQISGLDLFFSIVIITIQSYYLGKISDDHRLFDHTSNLPAFILVLNYSLISVYHFNSPVLLANLFLIMALLRILTVYNQPSVSAGLFRAGFYIGVAALFYKPAAVFYFIISYQLLVFRTFNWREHLIPLLALLIPILYMLSYYFMSDQIEVFSSWLTTGEAYYTEPRLDLYFYLPIAMLLMISLLALVHLFQTSLKRTIRVNNLYKVLLVTVLLPLLLLIIIRLDIPSLLIMCLPALSIIQANYLLGIERTWIRESLVYLTIILVFVREFNLI